MIFKLHGSTFIIGCIFIKPKQKQENEFLKNTLLKALAFKETYKTQESIFMGDFNARHHLCGDNRHNEAGLSLLKVPSLKYLYVGNTKELTFTSINGWSSVSDLYTSSDYLSHFTLSTAIGYEIAGVKCSRPRTLSGTTMTSDRPSAIWQ